MKKTILVEGMSCKHCVAHVKEALEEIGGKNVEVSLEKNTAEGEFHEQITDEAIKNIVEDYGYDVKKID